MSSETKATGESDLSAGDCFGCGRRFAACDLKRASMPPFFSLAAAIDVEPGDTEPPLLFADPNWYCPSCRFRVNLRRSLLTIAFLIFTMVSASIAAMLWRGWF